jgi:hypothetical protein
MAEDPIRALLASLPPADFSPKPPGTVAIARSAVTAAVEESDQAPDAVAAWIAEKGGRLMRPPPVRSRERRAGRQVAQTVPVDPCYVIPAQALREAPGGGA